MFHNACIVDVQGFQFKSNPFICKELAIKKFSLENSCCHNINKFVFNYPIEFKYLNSNIQNQINFLTKKKHGLDWYSLSDTPFLYQYSDLGKILQTEIIDKDCKTILVKGEQKAKWLGNMFNNSINIINIEDYGCPSISVLKNETKSLNCNLNCLLHYLSDRSCAVENVQLFNNWLFKINSSLPIEINNF